MPRYNPFNCRPYEIFRYSYDGEKLRFDYSQLKKYHLRDQLLPGIKNENYKPSLKTGCNKYKRTVYSNKESKIEFFAITLAAYEFLTKPLDKFKDNNNEIEILCHNGVHNDLILNTNDIYNIILYKNKLIISNTATRANQNQLLSYIGIKFESILTNEPSPTNGSNFKILLEGKFGKWPFKSVAEIDSFKGNYFDKKDNKEKRIYTEIKLCFINGITVENISELNNDNKEEILLFLKENVNYFNLKFKKWLIQSFFGIQDYLVIGIRNEKYQLICNFELDLKKDFIPFVKKYYPNFYETFLNSIDTLDRKYDIIYQQVKELQNSEKDVFEFHCNKLQVKKISDGNKNDEMFHNILVPEYLAMVDKNRDILFDSKYINKEAYIELKMGSLNI
jgi:hypothetical protein